MIEKLSCLCSVCRTGKFKQMGTRIDNRTVVCCENCGMGVLEEIPNDLSIFYGDGYYGDVAGLSLGYTDDYSKMSFHTAAWASFVAKLFKSSGQVLDIGCVDGFLLDQFGPKFVKFGIEMNARMSLRAQERGIDIIGSDLFDPKIIESYAGKFDLITAIAVFEHLRDFRKGIENAIRLLADDGILLFEVPLISEQNDNSVWFSSSLEHVFYPTIESLRYLAEEELKLNLIGSEIFVREYASTYVGIICKSPIENERVATIFARISNSSEPPRSDEEHVASVHLNLIHAANSTSDLIADLHCLPIANSEMALINRIQQIWSTDLRHLKNTREALKSAIEQRDYYHKELLELKKISAN
jgi:O-antigen biosynthesis protein